MGPGMAAGTGMTPFFHGYRITNWPRYIRDGLAHYRLEEEEMR
jgi:hypothetical protein